MRLQILNMSKTYGNGVRALDGVSLTIPQGMFGLVGPNGSGKTTLMRTIATLQEPDTGSARLGDIDVLKDKESVRRVLGYLPLGLVRDPLQGREVREERAEYVITYRGQPVARLVPIAAEEDDAQALEELERLQADAGVYSSPERAREVAREKAVAEARLAGLYAEWESAASALEDD